MKTKTLLIYLSICFTTIVLSQNKNKTINVSTDLSGLHCDNKPPNGPCGISYPKNKSSANTQVGFDKENNELTFIFSKTNLEETNKLKLLSNELEKDFYLYTFDEDFILSNDIKKALNIKDLSKIKKGNYLVKVNKDQIIMKLKLE